MLKKQEYGNDFSLFAPDTVLLLTPLVFGAIVTTSWMVTEYGVKKLCSRFFKK